MSNRHAQKGEVKKAALDVAKICRPIGTVFLSYTAHQKELVGGKQPFLRSQNLSLPFQHVAAMQAELISSLYRYGVDVVLEFTENNQLYFTLSGSGLTPEVIQAVQKFVAAQAVQTHVPDIFQTARMLAEKVTLKKRAQRIAIIYEANQTNGLYRLITPPFDKLTADEIADKLLYNIGDMDGIEIAIEPTPKAGVFCVALSGAIITPRVGNIILQQQGTHIKQALEEKQKTIGESPLDAAIAAGDAAQVELLIQNISVTAEIVRTAIYSPKAPEVIAKLLPKFDASLLVTAIKETEARLIKEIQTVSSSLNSGPVDPEAKQTTGQPSVVTQCHQVLRVLLNVYEEILTALELNILNTKGQKLIYEWQARAPFTNKLESKQALAVEVADRLCSTLFSLPLIRQYGLTVVAGLHLSDKSKFAVEITGPLLAAGLGHYCKEERHLRLSRFRNDEGDYEALNHYFCAPLATATAGSVDVNWMCDADLQYVRSNDLSGHQAASQARDALIIKAVRIGLNAQITLNTQRKPFIQLSGPAVEGFIDFLCKRGSIASTTKNKPTDEKVKEPSLSQHIAAGLNHRRRNSSLSVNGDEAGGVELSAVRRRDSISAENLSSPLTQFGQSAPPRKGSSAQDGETSTIKLLPVQPAGETADNTLSSSSSLLAGQNG